MFGTRTQLRNYLGVIKPWAMGKDNRGWFREDFQTLVTVDEGLAELRDREDVKAERTDPSHVIFPIRTYEVSLIDRLFLGSERLRAVANLNQSITSFNAALDAVNRASDKETKWGRMIVLHVGTIGTSGSGTLHDAWNIAWRLA